MPDVVSPERIAEIRKWAQKHGYDGPNMVVGDLLLALDAATAERDDYKTEAQEAATTIMVELGPIVADAAIVGRTYGWPEVIGMVMAVKRAFYAAEADLARLRAQGTDVASRLEMACKRMSVGSGARTRFEANRAGQREAYFASARLVRELFPAPRDTEGA